MLFCFVYIEEDPRPLVSFLNLSPYLPSPQCANSTNSFPPKSFNDPHLLNAVVSYRYEDSGEWVSADTVSPKLDSVPRRANSFALNLFADPPPLNSYGSIFYKNSGRGVHSLTPP